MKAETFQTHSEAGKKLIKKPANLPDNTKTIIYDYDEVRAWFSAAEELIVSSFGKHSSQWSKWKGLQKKFNEEYARACYELWQEYARLRA